MAFLRGRVALTTAARVGGATLLLFFKFRPQYLADHTGHQRIRKYAAEARADLVREARNYLRFPSPNAVKRRVNNFFRGLDALYLERLLDA
jgi:hypothetical protein